jgi:hypothetical protein
MKKNLLKLGALAFVVALAFGIAACPQPTEEGGVSGEDVIIRVWLNDKQTTIDSTTTVLLVLGDIIKPADKEAFKSTEPLPYPNENLDANQKWQPIITSAVNKSVSELEGLTGQALVQTTGATIVANQLNKVDQGTYVDFLLYKIARNKSTGTTATSPSTLQEGGSFYVWLNLNGTVYIYTKDSINGRHKVEDQIKDKYNGNVEKVDVHTGVNDFYLTNFSQ